MEKRLVPISVNKILVPVDASRHSKKAVELAVDIAKKWNAEIYLLHVIRTEIITDVFTEYVKNKKVPVLDYFHKQCERFLNSVEARVKSAKVKNVASSCVHGDPADEILKAAIRKKADLIIMGNRGMGKFSKKSIGSVSLKVVTYAPCTCITVK
jgi:nucleotide-binding universal stress UspA family protein